MIGKILDKLNSKDFCFIYTVFRQSELCKDDHKATDTSASWGRIHNLRHCDLCDTGNPV